jgi:putative nucleotidyltransferase with HDIG domain
LLPPFPAIAQRVLGLVGRQDTSIREVADLVRMDPSFSAELLHFANSPLFGARHEIKGLVPAVGMVGLDRIQNIATVAAMNRMFRSSARAGALRKIWVHCLVAAVIAEEAARLNQMPSGVAYTVGLLHDLGILALMSAHPDQYARMIEASGESGFDLIACERDCFEIDHCDAGAYLAGEWEFPDELATAIAGHHDAPVADQAGLDNLARISWRLADALGFAAFPIAEKWTYEDLIALLPNTASWLGESAEAARHELDARVSNLPV